MDRDDPPSHSPGGGFLAPLGALYRPARPGEAPWAGGAQGGMMPMMWTPEG